jgi:hypothetical protein
MAGRMPVDPATITGCPLPGLGRVAGDGLTAIARHLRPTIFGGSFGKPKGQSIN